MELVNEYRNKCLKAFVTVFNRLCGGEKMSRYDIINEICRITGDDPYKPHSAVFFDMVTADNDLIRFDEKRIAVPNKRENIFLPAAYNEKCYLKEMLRTDYARLFFDDDIIDSINGMLGDIPDFPFTSYIEIRGTQPGDIIDDEFISRFRLLLKAVRENRLIEYSNKTRSGEMFTGQTAVPVRIEFSVRQRRFRLSMWSIQQSRPVKANISNMSDIKLLDEAEEREPIEKLMETKKNPDPIVMEVRDRNNSIERALLTFSIYDHVTEMRGDSLCRITLNYYTFDEEEIISSIMSFGPNIRVISPERAVDEIRSRITAELK